MQWFRVYSEVLDDPKVQRLAPELFKFWMNLLCLANHHRDDGVLPSVDDIAFRLRMDADEALLSLDQLVQVGLLDGDTFHGFWPHNWDERQPESDDAAARQRAHRAKKTPLVTGHVTDNETVTNMSSPRLDKTRVDTDTEQNYDAGPIANAPALVRDELFETMGDVCYGTYQGLNRTVRGRINTAIAELKTLEPPAAPEEVRAFAAAYRARSPDFELTPQTFSKGFLAFRNKPTSLKSNGAISHAAHRGHTEQERAVLAELTPISRGLRPIPTGGRQGTTP